MEFNPLYKIKLTLLIWVIKKEKKIDSSNVILLLIKFHNDTLDTILGKYNFAYGDELKQ